MLMLLGTGVAVVLGALAFVTVQTVAYWEDSTTLWRHALDVTQGNWLAECNYALAIEADGQAADAMPHFLASVQLNPRSAQAHFNYGGALQRRGDLKDAIAEYRRAAELYPPYSQASLAAGTLLIGASQFASAADVFAAAARTDPLFVPMVHFCRGADLLQHNRPAEAIGDFRQALSARPDYLLAHMGLGVALLKTGHPIASAEQFRLAQQLSPNDPAIERNLRAATQAASTQALIQPPLPAAPSK
jgi:tetratricopeptide (TPR) repeat protein